MNQPALYWHRYTFCFEKAMINHCFDKGVFKYLSSNRQPIFKTRHKQYTCTQLGHSGKPLNNTTLIQLAKIKHCKQCLHMPSVLCVVCGLLFFFFRTFTQSKVMSKLN